MKVEEGAYCKSCGRIGDKIGSCPAMNCYHKREQEDKHEDKYPIHELKIMTQKIHVKYYQDPGGDLPNMFYQLDMEAENYYKALEYLTNIMNTCRGVITFTSIEKI